MVETIRMLFKCPSEQFRLAAVEALTVDIDVDVKNDLLIDMLRSKFKSDIKAADNAALDYYHNREIMQVYNTNYTLEHLGAKV